MENGRNKEGMEGEREIEELARSFRVRGKLEEGTVT